MNLRLYQRPSPNFNARPAGAVIDAIVLHADAARAIKPSLDHICTRHARKEDNVSYHFLIGRMGHVYQCVAERDRAWHAGVSSFAGRRDCNDFAIGVSFGNAQDGREAFAIDALAAGIELCAQLIRRHPAITPERITMHSAVALPPGRKRDPGPLFPFESFVNQVRIALGAPGRQP